VVAGDGWKISGGKIDDDCAPCNPIELVQPKKENPEHLLGIFLADY
jgi:hypothetical protein